VIFFGVRSGHAERRGSATHRQTGEQTGRGKAILHAISPARKEDVDPPVPGIFGAT
jgi:hypothetical protein